MHLSVIVLLLVALLEPISVGAADEAATLNEQECQTDTSTLDQEVDSSFLQEKIFTQQETVADPFSNIHGGGAAPPNEQEGYRIDTAIRCQASLP